jgi:K+-transporting ATPase KdpF subunit
MSFIVISGAAVAALLVVYLFAALLVPEKFQ